MKILTNEECMLLETLVDLRIIALRNIKGYNHSTIKAQMNLLVLKDKFVTELADRGILE